MKSPCHSLSVRRVRVQWPIQMLWQPSISHPISWINSNWFFSVNHIRRNVVIEFRTIEINQLMLPLHRLAEMEMRIPHGVCANEWPSLDVRQPRISIFQWEFLPVDVWNTQHRAFIIKSSEMRRVERVPNAIPGWTPDWLWNVRQSNLLPAIFRSGSTCSL